MTIWQDFAARIPARMRQQPIDFVERFEQEGPAVLSFDRSLTRKVYAVLRQAAFAYVNAGELRGKRLLDVACGTGHETADIWLWLDGDVQIVAVDPVRGLIELAEQSFDRLVAEAHDCRKLSGTDGNRPTFHVMNAMDLDFPDESFDIVFHSLLLHWTPDPAHAVQELARVLKPGGVVLGTQICKPMASPYMGLITRVHENVHGYFEQEDFYRWYEQAGVRVSMVTPAGVFKGRKLGG
jgi:ubiquinone/menaquinone biosynthesis C-methylase UbiE